MAKRPRFIHSHQLALGSEISFTPAANLPQGRYVLLGASIEWHRQSGYTLRGLPGHLWCGTSGDNP